MRDLKRSHPHNATRPLSVSASTEGGQVARAKIDSSYSCCKDLSLMQNCDRDFIGRTGCCCFAGRASPSTLPQLGSGTCSLSRLVWAGSCPDWLRAARQLANHTAQLALHCTFLRIRPSLSQARIRSSSADCVQIRLSGRAECLVMLDRGRVEI